VATTNTDLTAPPDTTRRAAPRVQTNLRGAALALVFAVVIEAAFIAGLFFFDSSLRHHLPGHSTCPPTVEQVESPSATTTPSTIENKLPGVPGLATGGSSAPTTTEIKVDCGVAGAGLAVARGIEIALGIAGFAVVWFGLRAVVLAFRARRLALDGQGHDARVAAEDSRDAVWYVVGIGLTVAVLAFVCLLLGANGGKVRTVLFNWRYPWRSRDALAKAFLWNIKLFLVSEVLVLVWALIVAIVRQLPGKATAPIRWLAIAYTDVFRGIPAIMTIYLIVFGFALADIKPFTSFTGNAQLFWLGVFALVLVYGAYVAEVYRAGLESIHWSQTAAARSLGLSQWQTYRYVIVPQAVRRIIPPLLNDFVALQKDTALVGLVGLIEIFNQSTLLNSHYFNLSPITFAALFFLILTIPLTRFVDYLIKRDQERTRAG
jgi:polar amino acid transport system permease protein